MKKFIFSILGLLVAVPAFADFIGDFAPATTAICGQYTTFNPSTGAPFTLAGTPALSVYKIGDGTNSGTESTTGVTHAEDVDTRTGMNRVCVDTSADGTFYSAGGQYSIVITTGTVNSVSVVGSEVKNFSLNKVSALRPTTAGRTLDVSTGGEAGLDWANVGSPTTTLALTGTTIATTQKVDLETIKTQAVTAAAGVTIPSSIASPTNITAGTITTTINLTNAPPNTAADAILLEALVLTQTELTADSGGTTTSFVDAALTQATNNWFNGGVAIHFSSGTLLDQFACVVAFTAASDTLSFSPAVTTAVTTHNYYLIPDAACAFAENDTGLVRFSSEALEQAPTAGGGNITQIEGTDATDVIDARILAANILRPTTAGRTLDVTTTGEAGIDWANIGSPTTTVNLSGTSTKAVEPTTAGRTLDIASTGEAGVDFDNIKVTNGAPAIGFSANGTLSGTHTATTADLGTNAPGATSQLVGMTLDIPSKHFSELITAYDTSTGIATFASTALTLANADAWFLWNTPAGSGATDVNLITVEGTDATTYFATLDDATLSAVDAVDNFVDTEVAGIQTYLNTNLGLLGANATAADDAVMTRIGTNGAGLTALPWNAAWDAEVQSEADDALRVLFLDQLLLNTYNPASPPGATDSLLEDLVENNSGVTRFTAAALVQAPTGGGGGTNITTIEGTDATDVLDARIAAAGLATAASLTTVGSNVSTAVSQTTAAAFRTALGLATANLDMQFSTTQSYIDTEVGAIKTVTDKFLFTSTNFLQTDVQYMNAQLLLGTGMSGDKWRGQ